MSDTTEREGRRPIVFSSIVDEAMSERLRRNSNALTLDLFQVFISPLETELEAKSSHAAGRSHGIANSHEYFARMDAINFSQAHDDGAATRDLDRAQVILVGVSRCGKTPTRSISRCSSASVPPTIRSRRTISLIRALPASVLPHKDRLFGLTINPDRLHMIREERRPRSKYAALENCRYEVRECEHLFEREGIPMLDTTAKSIEEIATTITYRAKLRRHIIRRPMRGHDVARRDSCLVTRLNP
jgi:regulator of PEP synthase PpsR (kinase-PPPase family)